MAKVVRYRLNELKANMKLARDVYAEDGRVILRDGTYLTETLIKLISSWGVRTADVVADDTASAPTVEDVVYDESKFLAEYSQTVRKVKEVFDSVRYFKEVPIRQMQEMADQTIELFIDTFGIVNHLHVMRHVDDYTFHHSVNVAIISGILGKWMGYSGEFLKDIILAGLLHDIGKSQVPLPILNKPGKLTADEMQLMRLHPTFAYELIINTVSNHVLAGVVQHHERIDGTGYPLGLKGDIISPVAKIIAVADLYDAMTSERVYHRAQTPFEAVEELNKGMYNQFDVNICNTFLSNVRDYFIGNEVRLSDGRIAKIVALGVYSSSRPLVITVQGEFIDLEQRKDIAISDIVIKT